MDYFQNDQDVLANRISLLF